MIRNALFGLSYALESNYSKVYIEKLINSGVILNYVNKYFSSEYKIMISKTIFPFLGVIGNISCNQTKDFDYLINIKAINIVVDCIEEYYSYSCTTRNALFERALWVLSNIVSDSPINSLFLVKSEVMEKLFKIITIEGLDQNVAYEIIYCLFGCLHCEEPAISIEYFNKGIVDVCYLLLKFENLKILDVVCNVLNFLIMQGFLFQNEGIHQRNIFIERFVKIGGTELIESIILNIGLTNDNETYCKLSQIEKWCKNF
jgi:hypothetical protein